MGVFRTTVEVKRTIFPYPDGWGVVILRPFKNDTVVDVGLTKEHAEEMAELTRRQLKEK